jgi:hypothetical protein
MSYVGIAPVVLNSSMNWNEVSIHTTPNSYPKPATPGIAPVKEESGKKHAAGLQLLSLRHHKPI